MGGAQGQIGSVLLQAFIASFYCKLLLQAFIASRSIQANSYGSCLRNCT
jgi:hypothetical protein